MKKFYKPIAIIISVLFCVSLVWAGTAKMLKYGATVRDEGAAHDTPRAGYGDIYVNDDVPYFINDSGVSTSMIGGATATGFSLAADADAGNFDIKSIAQLEFFDTGLVIDGDTNGVLSITSDGTLALNSADWDISTTGVITNASISADQVSAAALTLGNFYLSIGTEPADAGTIRLPNAGSILFENSTPGTDIDALNVDSSEIIQIGASGASGVTVTPALTLSGTLTVNGSTMVGDGATQVYGFVSLPVDGAAGPVNIEIADSGKTYYNSEACTFNLPACANGLVYTFVVAHASQITVHPDGTDRILILTDTNGDKITSSTPGDTVTLRGIGAIWYTEGVFPAYTDWADGGA